MSDPAAAVDLALYAIYGLPADYPSPFAVRVFRFPRDGEVAGGPPVYHQTLEAARATVPPGLTRFEPEPKNDARYLLETWE